MAAQIGVKQTQDSVMYCTISFAASAAAQTVTTGTIYPYGYDDSTNTTSYQVPSGSVLQLVDVYNTSTPATDGQLVFKVNGIKQGENFVLSGLNATNSGRTRLSQPLNLYPGDTFAIQGVNFATASTAAASNIDTVLLHFLKVPA